VSDRSAIEWTDAAWNPVHTTRFPRGPTRLRCRQIFGLRVVTGERQTCARLHGVDRHDLEPNAQLREAPGAGVGEPPRHRLRRRTRRWPLRSIEPPLEDLWPLDLTGSAG